jgi:tetratricopeptide (TPR) repeat protein
MDEITPPKPLSDDAGRRLQLIVSLAVSGDRAGAVAEANSLADKVVAAEAWRSLAEINANLQRWDDARSDIENALRHQPISRPLRLSRALLAEQQGKFAESLAELEALAAEAGDSQKLALHLGRALQFAGRTADAEAQFEAGLRRWPTDVALHVHLARLRWQNGDGEQSTRTLEQAIEAYPLELHLRLVAADLLRNAGAAPRALTLLEHGLAMAPGSAAFLTSIGVMRADLGDVDEALRHLRAAVVRAPQSAPAKRNLVSVLLRTGAASEALRLSEELSALAPDDQQLIAYRATALRLLGDPRYAELHDYPRLVRQYTLEPPAPYSDIAQFNAAFAHELAALHRGHRPLDQSLRGGSQTERNLPRDNPVIAAFFAMLDAPIRDYIARLRDGDSAHPTDRRKSAGYRIAGSWSVQLQPRGFHINHVHPQGWLSSAYYVELPDVADASTRAGWLKFGEPGIPVAACEPDMHVKPYPGLLVLFPSYVWHGTVPFETGGRRLTAAFDVLPG